MSLPPAPKRTRIITGIALIGFAALFITGPLQQATLVECLFAAALLLISVVLIALLTRRFAFALALPSVVFGGLLIASVLKFHYLTTPLLAPDLVYFLNRDLLEIALHYPSILFALIGGAVLIPGLLILAWRLDRPRLFASSNDGPRRSMQGAGALAAIALLLAVDSPAGPFSAVFEKGMWQAMNDKSYLVNFFTSFYQTEIKIPPRPRTSTRTCRGRNRQRTTRRHARTDAKRERRRRSPRTTPTSLPCSKKARSIRT